MFDHLQGYLNVKNHIWVPSLCINYDILNLATGYNRDTLSTYLILLNLSIDWLPHPRYNLTIFN